MYDLISKIGQKLDVNKSEYCYQCTYAWAVILRFSVYLLMTAFISISMSILIYAAWIGFCMKYSSINPTYIGLMLFLTLVGCIVLQIFINEFARNSMGLGKWIVPVVSNMELVAKNINRTCRSLFHSVMEKYCKKISKKD